MKKLLISLILFLIFACFISAQELPKITIINNTGYPVYMIFVSPNDEDSWGEPALEGQTIETGNSVEIRLKVPLTVTSVYDILLVDTDDDTYSKFAVKVKANEKIEFTFDDFVNYE
ncbi:MAG: hypothetical protein FWB86_07255 [Treponema sp.]|nr:hypothetical protein [Treponema sp.]MCL2252022.1 hypothetical protein [Treponema sp.]